MILLILAIVLLVSCVSINQELHQPCVSGTESTINILDLMEIKLCEDDELEISPGDEP